MSKMFNIFKAELTEDEERYINDRNDLLQARQEAEAHGRLEEAEEFEDERLAEEDEEPEGIPVEDWVKQPEVTKADIITELKSLKVEFDPKATKPELGALLVSKVSSQR